MACETTRGLFTLPAARPRRSRALRRTLTLAAFAIGLGLFAGAVGPSNVAAQDAPGGLKDNSPHDRPMILSFFTGINWGYYASYGFPFNLGGRFYIPIMRDGFIPPINDEFGIEFGLDFNFVFISDRYSYYEDSTVFGVGFPVEALYDFHFSRSFDAYVKLGIIFGADFSDYLHDGFYVNAISAVGMRLWFTDNLMFRAEAGFPWIKAGIGIAF
jgi:hypothetical protein